MKFIVAYDISDNKRLIKLSNYLEKHGVRVQYSVFEIETSLKEIKNISSKVSQIIDKETDKVFIYPFDHKNKVERIGKLQSIYII